MLLRNPKWKIRFKGEFRQKIKEQTTTPYIEVHSIKNTFDVREKWPLHLSGKLQQLSLIGTREIQAVSTGFEPMTSVMPVQCWCNASAMLSQLSYEATQLRGGQFVGLMC